MNGVEPDVAVDKAPPQLVGNGGSHAAAAEEVSNEHTLVRREAKNTL